MPHFIVEYSANLEQRIDIDGLLETIQSTAIETGVFPRKGIRVRAARREHYRIADNHPDNAFVHVLARIGMGRTPEVRRAASETLFNTICEYLKPDFEHNPLAISFEMVEIEKDTSFKLNNLPKWLETRQEDSKNG